MRRAFAILLLLFAFNANAVTNEVNGTFDATSYDGGIYYLWGNYFATAFYSEYPQWTNHIYSWSRSGSGIGGDYLEQEFKRCAPFWNYSTNITVFDWVLAANDDGGYDSNGLVSAWNQLASGPPIFWNGSVATNEGVPFPSVVHIPFGGIPADSPDGDSGQIIRNNAATNLAAHAGVPVVDMWHMLATNGWSRDLTNGRLLGFYAGGHPYPAGHLCMAIKTLQALSVNTNFGVDTNVGSFTLDMNNAIVSATNRCVVTGVSLVGSTLTCTVRFDRMPMAWDVPDGFRTNDARAAFLVMPELGSAFQWTIQVTNLPSGNYKIFVDGVLTDTATEAQLAAGRNWFTNYNGPLWAQRVAVLNAKRDQEGSDRNTLEEHSPGVLGVLGIGDLITFQSWAGVHGEYYPGTYTGTNYVNYMAGRVADMRQYDVEIWRAAQQTNHVFTISPAGQTITFPALDDQIYGVPPVTLGATASSGLTVIYSVTSGPASVSGNLLTITGPGSITVQASQPGNANWPAAIPVNRTITVAQKTLAPSITASNKTYDGTSTATTAIRGLTGVVSDDSVVLNVGLAVFPDKTSGVGRTVTATGLSLSGTDAAKYLLASTSATTTANITPATVTVTGVTASDKVYDGTTNATVSATNAVLSGIIGADAVTLAGTPTGAFTDAEAAVGKPITVRGLILVGVDASNYSLVQPSATASITKARTSNTIDSSPNPAPTGSNVILSATLTVISPGGGTPTGNVVFKDGAIVLGTNALNGLAAAFFNVSTLSHSVHTVIAEYSGDQNFLGSTNSSAEVIDRAPTIASVSLRRYPAGGTKVRLSALLTNAADLDGDALSLVYISTNTASGATISTNGDWIFYQPPLGFTNSDAFSWAVADSFGRLATGSIAVLVIPDTNAPQNFVSGDSVGGINPNGGQENPSIQFLGIPLRVYTIQYTTNLLTQDWRTLGTATADKSGFIEFFDDLPAGSPPRTYRTTYP